MTSRSTWTALLTVTLLASACGRGCGGDPAPTAATVPTSAASTEAQLPTAATTTAVEAAQAAATDARSVAKALGLTLPERRNDAVLPAFDSLPRRRLRGFQVERQLIVRVDATWLRVLDTELATKTLVEDEPITAALRQAAQAWGQRSGVAATRLVLAFDKDVDRELAARIRRLAHTASSWRVVALAVEGGDLFEVLLDPPPDRRP